MDVSTLKQQVAAARAFEVTCGDMVFTLTLPSEHDYRTTLEAHRDTSGRILESAAFRVLLDAAVTGWRGVTMRDVLPEADDTPMPFNVDTRALLLDHRQDVADELSIAIATKRRERADAREAARKNLPSGSSGT